MQIQGAFVLLALQGSSLGWPVNQPTRYGLPSLAELILFSLFFDKVRLVIQGNYWRQNTPVTLESSRISF